MQASRQFTAIERMVKNHSTPTAVSTATKPATTAPPVSNPEVRQAKLLRRLQQSRPPYATIRK